MQTLPDYLTQLLDFAKEKSGSDYATAKRLGVSRNLVSDWRAGRKSCSPEDVAQLAAIAELEADKWLIRAVIAKHEGTPKGDRLYLALGKALAATGAALVSSGAHALPIFSINLIRCILLLNRRQLSP